MRLYATVGLLAMMSHGCSEPRCPSDLIQVGNACRRCPDGTEKSGSTCVSADTGIAMDPEPEAEGSDDPSSPADTAQEDAAQVRDDAGLGQAGGSMSPPSDANTATERCFVDKDKDGTGAGNSVNCQDRVLIDSLGFALSALGTDCDDSDPKRSPSFSDACGDAIDNDCDGVVDDETNNPCGGPCSVQLTHHPGELCDNGMQGACLKKGAFTCDGSSVRCNAPGAAPSPETCGDAIDNDCDGSIDEPDAINALVWYQDCDADGYAASIAGSIRSCEKPSNVGSCSWTTVIPQPDTKSNWDCNDSSSAYSPSAGYGFPPGQAMSWDLNCDGLAVADPMFWPSSKKVCVTSISDWFTRGSPSCPTQHVGDGCYVFKNPEGGFSRPGSEGNNASRIVTCPDVPYVVTLGIQTGVCELSSRPQEAVWPCR